jgi:hypothetical protein
MSDANFPKNCRCCGSVYDAVTWAALPLVGTQVIPADETEPELVLEYRNCLCPGRELVSTLAIEITIP